MKIPNRIIDMRDMFMIAKANIWRKFITICFDEHFKFVLICINCGIKAVRKGIGV